MIFVTTPAPTVCPQPSPTCYDLELHKGQVWTVPATSSEPWGAKGDIELRNPTIVFYDMGSNSGRTGTVVIFESLQEIIGPCNGANVICLSYRGCGSVNDGIRSLVSEMLNVAGNCGSPQGCDWVHVFVVRNSAITSHWWENDSGVISQPAGITWPANGAALCNPYRLSIEENIPQ